MAELPMRIKKPIHLPLIGQFSDEVKFAGEGVHAPINMWMDEEEELKDDEDGDDTVVKDAAFWKERRKHRQMFGRGRNKKHELLKIQDSLPRKEDDAPNGLIFEGKEWSPGIESDPLAHEKTASSYRHSKASQEEVKKLSNYAIFQMVKRKDETTGKTMTEVEIIPVEQFYLFKKPSVMGTKSLDDIDDDYEANKEAEAKLRNKYKNLFKAQNMMDDDEAEGGPRGRGRPAKGTAARPIVRDSEGKFNLENVFGITAKQKMRKNVKKGKNANAKQYLDENGVDLDEVKEVGDMFRGDFEQYLPNNDDIYDDKHEAQMEEEDKEEQIIGRKKVHMGDEDEEEMDSEEEEEEEVKEGEEVISEQAGVKDGTITMLDDMMLLQARKSSKVMDKKMTKALQAQAALEAAEREGADSGRKRGREGDDESGRVAKAMKYELTEDGIYSFLKAHSGVVTITELRKQFKDQVKAKATGGNKHAGAEYLSNLIKNSTSFRVNMDPVKGKVIEIKQ